MKPLSGLLFSGLIEADAAALLRAARKRVTTTD
jgi:hypothetical protein